MLPPLFVPFQLLDEFSPIRFKEPLCAFLAVASCIRAFFTDSFRFFENSVEMHLPLYEKANKYPYGIPDDV